MPLNDKQTAEDSALAGAVKTYWKASPVKFIPFSDFHALRVSKNKPPNYIYLIEETYIRFKRSRKDWAHVKYYLSPLPGGVEVMDAPYIEFRLPVETRKKELIYPDYSFLFALMMKQLSYDVALIGRPEEYEKITRKDLVKASFRKELKEHAAKPLLTSESDFENFLMNVADEKKTSARIPQFKAWVSGKTRIDSSRIRIAPDGEIMEAVQKNRDVLIYTGFTIYSAKDGRLLRRIDASSGKRKMHAVGTLTISAALLAVAAYIFFG